jgi:hypothetical protein
LHNPNSINRIFINQNQAKMKKMRLILLAAGMMVSSASLMFTSCTKEGPAGPAGANGTNGTNGTNGADGKDANETCKICHAANVVDAIAVEFQMSKHNWGAAAFEEAGNASCGPCHEQKAYIYVVKNNIPATFTFNGTTGKWVNDYSSVPSDAIGAIGCWTCHSSLHTTYDTADIALTTVAPVAMTMWGGAKTINLPADGGQSHLCVKCHQPRPLTATAAYDFSSRLINYDSLKNFPTVMFYDTVAGAQNKNIRPSYRMHVHYGPVGAVMAGMGAIEFPGSRTYANSKHTEVASCQDCHMAQPMYGVAGGHAFNMRNAIESALGSSTTWNFNGCNTADCHGADPLDKESALFKDTRTEIKGLLDDLAAKINSCAPEADIFHSATVDEGNLWAGITTNNYDGYMDIYDAGSNPEGYWRNPGVNTPVNNAKPKFPKLLNVQMGAIINFQFCLREYSLGIHNTKYVKALLVNTKEALEAAGL